MTAPIRISAADIIESVLVKGDLSKLTADERNSYYIRVCESIGLNPLTRPLEYITLQGKMVLYAKRDAADQLRKINNISIEIVSQNLVDDLLTIHARAKDGSGRTDEDFGVVFMPSTIKGEPRANLILKAVTKAKRRVTLSISGLGLLDETEVETIPSAQPVAETEPKRIAPVPSPRAPIPSPTASAPPPQGPHEVPATGQSYAMWARAFLNEVANVIDPQVATQWAALNIMSLRKLNSGAADIYIKLMSMIPPMVYDAIVAANTPAGTPPHPHHGDVVWDETEERPATAEDHDPVTGEVCPAYATDPEKHFQFVAGKLREQTTRDGLNDVWARYVEPVNDALFPPDRSALSGVMKVCWNKLEA